MSNNIKTEGAFKQSLSFNPFQEEPHVNLALMQYFQYLSSPNSSRKEDITRRLYFILSMNPKNKKSQKLLVELAKEYEKTD
ncbi:MAG: hypothetical protein ACE5KZ_01990 [Candidatus Scalinduaceae bacterium]